MENSPANTNVGSPVSATDPESDTLTYFLMGADSGRFGIESTTGQISVGATATFDIESPSDANADNVYEVTVRVTDGWDPSGNPDDSVDTEIVVKITVTDVNEPPVFEFADLDLEIAENLEPGATVGDPVAAADPESATLTYSMSGLDSGVFSIEPQKGHIIVGTGITLDFESPADHDRDNIYELLIHVTDGAGEDGNPDTSADATMTLTITVADVNEPPAFEISTVEWELPENAEAKTSVGHPVLAFDAESNELSYSLGGADFALFSVDAITGQISVGADAALDYESPIDVDVDNIYVLVVQVTDGHDEDGNVDVSVDAEISVSVTVVDVNEPPAFENLYVRYGVDENTPASSHVGEPVLALDPELAELTYTLAGADSDLFEFDSSTGLLSVGEATVLDYETPADSNGDNVYELVLQVSDGTDEDGKEDASIDDEIGVIVSVTNVNEPGEAASLAYRLTILENIPVNTDVGHPIQAEAPDELELRYSLAGADAASFAIEDSSGQISTRVGLDFESPADADGDNVYKMVVQVTDGEDAEGNDDPSVDDEIGVEIRVLDINEAPEVVGAIRDRTLVQSDGIEQFDVSTYFRDPDGDEMTYEAMSSDSRVAGVGVVGATLAIAPAGTGTAIVEVTAIDPSQLRTRQSFTVSVVSAQVGVGGFLPIIPPAHQGSSGATGAGTDPAYLLSESDVLVVPRTVSLRPGQTVSMHAVAFNLLGDALPVGLAGVSCAWSSDFRGTFIPNGTGKACATTFTAPAVGDGTIVVRVTQGRVTAVGTAAFEVIPEGTNAANLERAAFPRIEFPADVTGSVVWRGDGASVTSPSGLTVEVPAGAIDADYLGVSIREMSIVDMVVPDNPGFAVGSYAGDFSFTDETGEPMPGFRTTTPVRICLPFTMDDVEQAVGGVDGVHVVHVTPDWEYVRCPSNSDLESMMTCAEVDHFSVYFVGLAVAAPTPTAAPTTTAGPIHSPTATPLPTPDSTQSPEPEYAPTRGPTLESTPLLPVAGDARPGPGVLVLITLPAVAAITTGVALLRRVRPARPFRSG